MVAPKRSVVRDHLRKGHNHRHLLAVHACGIFVQYSVVGAHDEFHGLIHGLTQIRPTRRFQTADKY